MKNIRNYDAEKYTINNDYKKIDTGIYETKDEDSMLYVTSLIFVQEPEYDEGEFADGISQYPLEDVLDKYLCHVSDFYEELNQGDSIECYLEFASYDIDDIRSLRNIIGKHVYNISEKEGDNEIVKLIIE